MASVSITLLVKPQLVRDVEHRLPAWSRCDGALISAGEGSLFGVRMPYYRRKRRRYQLWGALLPWFWGAVGLAALGGLWYGLMHVGPREVASPQASPAATKEEVAAQALSREVEQLWGALRRTEGTPEIALLEEAVMKQRELVDLGSGGQAEVRRLAELETQLETLRAVALNRQIDQWVQRAEEGAGAADGDPRSAVAAWQEALRLQRQINRGGAAAVEKNFVREQRMEQRLQELETQPLADEVAAAMQAAREALDDQRWAEALLALTSARATQLRINQEFSRSRFANLSRLDEIEREIETLDAAAVAIEVDEQETAGDTAMAASDFEAAVAAYEQARQTQLRLNREFSRSRFLSSPRVEELEVKRQTASSIPRLENVRAEVGVIDSLLRRREVGLAAERIVLAADQLENVFAQLPKSEGLEAPLRLKLSYLAAQTAQLREIQDVLYEGLRPLPGVGERRLLQTEFPQALYLQVMRVNPSRNPGRAFPVDSVNWLEAQACCERLSWILARPVRLPTVDEFRVAVGDATRQQIEATDASVSQAMATGPANEAGFYDLLGNLAEWLQPASTSDPLLAAVGGGSFRDDVSTRRTIPVQELARTERSRHVGFRVVVEFDEP